MADIDTAISDGPGVRWVMMGPHLNFHLTAGGVCQTHSKSGQQLEAEHRRQLHPKYGSDEWAHAKIRD
jgi:hypothetical protein